jgi:ribosomal protein S27AE
MADERKWGKAAGSEPPAGPGAMGTAEPPPAGEVEGHGKQFVATCFNCGASSYIGGDWKWFTCWKCGATSAEMVA